MEKRRPFIFFRFPSLCLLSEPPDGPIWVAISQYGVQMFSSEQTIILITVPNQINMSNQQVNSLQENKSQLLHNERLEDIFPNSTACISTYEPMKLQNVPNYVSTKM